MGDRYQPIVTYAVRPRDGHAGKGLGEGIRANSKGLATAAGATSLVLAAYVVLYSGFPSVGTGSAGAESGATGPADKRWALPKAAQLSGSAKKAEIAFTMVESGRLSVAGRKSAEVMVPPTQGTRLRAPFDHNEISSELVPPSNLAEVASDQIRVLRSPTPDEASSKKAWIAVETPSIQLLADQGRSLPPNLNQLSDNTLAADLSVPDNFMVARAPSQLQTDRPSLVLAERQSVVERPGSAREAAESMQTGVIAKAVSSPGSGGGPELERISSIDVPPTAPTVVNENPSSDGGLDDSAKMRPKSNDAVQMGEIRASLERLNGKHQARPLDRNLRPRIAAGENDRPVKAVVLAPSGQSFGDNLELQIHDGELVSVRLSELISLFEDKLDRSLFVWLKTSAAAEKFVTPGTLEKAGIRLSYDAETRQAILSVTENPGR